MKAIPTLASYYVAKHTCSMRMCRGNKSGCEQHSAWLIAYESPSSFANLTIPAAHQYWMFSLLHSGRIHHLHVVNILVGQYFLPPFFFLSGVKNAIKLFALIMLFSSITGITVHAYPTWENTPKYLKMALSTLRLIVQSSPYLKPSL